MNVYMEVTKDIYELPVAIADTVKELARIRNVNPLTISSTMVHCRKRGHRSKYVRVVIEDD